MLHLQKLSSTLATPAAKQKTKHKIKKSKPVDPSGTLVLILTDAPTTSLAVKGSTIIMVETQALPEKILASPQGQCWLTPVSISSSSDPKRLSTASRVASHLLAPAAPLQAAPRQHPLPTQLPPSFQHCLEKMTFDEEQIAAKTFKVSVGFETQLETQRSL